MRELSFSEFKNDMKQIKKYWQDLDPTLRLLDIISLSCMVLFGAAFLMVYALNVPITITNVSFMLFPALVGAYTFVYRNRIAEEGSDQKAALKEYIMLIGISVFFVFLTFVYAWFEPK